MGSTPPGEEALSYRGVHLDGCHLPGRAPLAVEMVVSGTPPLQLIGPSHCKTPGGSWKILVVSAACGPPALLPAGLATTGKEDVYTSPALLHLLTPSDSLLSGFGSLLGAGVCFASPLRAHTQCNKAKVTHLVQVDL